MTIDRITRMIEVMDKTNGSLLVFFSLLIFCTIWLLFLHYKNWFKPASRTYLALFCSSITLVGTSKMNLCVIKNLSLRYWNQRIFTMMEIMTRTMEVTERINGSLLFFSLLVFCATWLFSLFYEKWVVLYRAQNMGI